MALPTGDEWAGRAYLLLSLAIVIWYYAPLLSPLVNPELEFASGDFYASPGPGSASSRFDLTFFTYNNNKETDATNRAFLVEWPSAITGLLGMTDSQTYSVLILAALALGVSGINRLCGMFKGCPGPLAVALSLFYFMNLWSVDRIGHTWIWLSYAVMPLLFALGIGAARGSRRDLAAYALVFAAYGMLPHSFIYLFILHSALALFAHFRAAGRKLPESALFFGLPLAVWLLANLPVFMLLRSAEVSYPMDTSEGTLALLSRNAEPLSILGMVNNWNPQVSKPLVLWNEPFRASAMALIAVMLGAAAAAYPNADRERRLLIGVAMLCFGCTMLVAEGLKSQLVRSGADALADVGAGLLVGPFREWGRIMLLAPVCLTAALAAGAGALGGRARAGATVALGMAVLAVAATSPGDRYIGDVFAPTDMPDDYTLLRTGLAGTSETLWVYPLSDTDFIGFRKFLWNRSKVSGNVLDDFGSSYARGLDVVQLMQVREAPPALLEALNIGTVVFRQDREGSDVFFVDYGWLDCTPWEYFILCRNDRLDGDAYAMEGSVFYGDYAPLLYSLTYRGGLALAPASSIDGSTRAVVVQDEAAALQALARGDAEIAAPARGKTAWARMSATEEIAAFGSGGALAWDVMETKMAYFTSRNNSIATLPFSVGKDGRYVLLGRILKGRSGGRIGLAMDGDYLGSVETLDGLWGFRWVKLGEAELGKGRHELRMTSQYGLNGVYGAAVIEKGRYEELRSELNGAYATYPNIHIIEAEQMLPHWGSGYVEAVPAAWASRGEAVRFLKDKPLDVQIEVERAGNYTLDANCKGTMEVELDGRTFITTHNGSGLLHIATVPLSEGAHNISVSATDGSMVDVIWLYGGGPDMLFSGRAPPAEIYDVEKIDPTLLRLKANASAPFLLVYSETANRLWEARVRKPGTEQAVVAPIRTYGAPAGYWINDTGEMDIEIRYVVQERFQLGLVVSAATLAACVAFIALWRERRGGE